MQPRAPRVDPHRRLAMLKQQLKMKAESLRMPLDTLDAQGNFSGRLTRAYSKEEWLRGAGMNEEELRNTKELTLMRQHGREVKVPIGEMKLDYNEEDKFVYIRGRINKDDGGPGTDAYTAVKNGDLRYLSLAFKHPEVGSCPPEQYYCVATEASLVDEPHDPYAELLTCHSTKDEQKLRINHFCLPVASTTVAMSAKDSAAATAEEKLAALQAQLAKADAALEEYKKKNSAYEAKHAAAMSAKRDGLLATLEGENALTPEHKELITTFANSITTDPDLAPVADWVHAHVEGHLTSKKGLTEAQKQLDSLTGKINQTPVSTGGWNNSSHPSNAAAPPAVTTQHAAGAATVPTTGSRVLGDRIKERMLHWRAGNALEVPAQKKQAQPMPSSSHDSAAPMPLFVPSQ